MGPRTCESLGGVAKVRGHIRTPQDVDVHVAQSLVAQGQGRHKKVAATFEGPRGTSKVSGPTHAPQDSGVHVA